MKMTTNIYGTALKNRRVEIREYAARNKRANRKFEQEKMIGFG